MRVLVIITNRRQASYRLRTDALRSALAQRGIVLDVQILPRTYFARRLILRSAENYDATILQRKLLDRGNARLLRGSAKKIFYDIDDAVMYHAHRVGWFSQWRTNRRFEATVKILDHVVAGNEYLADLFRQRGREVTVLPTCVDPAHYRVKEHAATDTIRLVWIGSHSTLPYLSEILPALRPFQDKNLRLITIADCALENAPVPVDHIPWSLETEAESLTRGDIGIAPTPDDRWTRGKCGFKIIQCMAAGLPVIASPVGANAQIVLENETGFLATTTEQWVEAIRKLAGDVELRQRFGSAGRERVEREYSLSRAVDTWTRMLGSERGTGASPVQK